MTAARLRCSAVSARHHVAAAYGPPAGGAGMVMVVRPAPTRQAWSRDVAPPLSTSSVAARTSTDGQVVVDVPGGPQHLPDRRLRRLPGALAIATGGRGQGRVGRRRQARRVTHGAVVVDAQPVRGRRPFDTGQRGLHRPHALRGLADSTLDGGDGRDQRQLGARQCLLAQVGRARGRALPHRRAGPHRQVGAEGRQCRPAPGERQGDVLHPGRVPLTHLPQRQPAHQAPRLSGLVQLRGRFSRSARA